VAAKPALGFVQIRSTDPPINLLARLADSPPTVTAGYGGWSEVARPRRASLSIWVGSPSLRMTLPIVFDNFRKQLSVERQISQLERLATPTASDGSPPRLRLVARGGHVPYQGRIWVVDSLTWGDATMNQNGNRTRQQCSLSLLEHVAGAQVTELSPALQARAKAKLAATQVGASNKRVVANHSATVTAQPKTRALDAGSSTTFGQGEDLLSIAARELGDADRWVEIAQLNGLRDPRAITPGQVIRLP